MTVKIVGLFLFISFQANTCGSEVLWHCGSQPSFGRATRGDGRLRSGSRPAAERPPVRVLAGGSAVRVRTPAQEPPVTSGALTGPAADRLHCSIVCRAVGHRGFPGTRAKLESITSGFGVRGKVLRSVIHVGYWNFICWGVFCTILYALVEKIKIKSKLAKWFFFVIIFFLSAALLRSHFLGDHQVLFFYVYILL